MLKTKTTIEIQETEHGFIGLGEMTVHHTRNDEHMAYYEFKDHNIRITLSPEKAKELFKRTIVNDKVQLSGVISIAAASCNISTVRVFEKRRYEETVFSRYLIGWYAYYKLDFAFQRIADIWGMNHSTFLAGINQIAGDPKYLKDIQRTWKNSFMKKLKERELI